MEIEIDSNSGFCFGVQRVIEMAEKSLSKGQPVYCLGEIVHNKEEVDRLSKMGMTTIAHTDVSKLSNATILFRAHGEPPSSYNMPASNNNLEDGTCPIVVGIQKKIKKAWSDLKSKNGTIVIFGKKDHAEVLGLAGQTNNEAIIVSSISDLDGINYTNPIALFAQTTMDMQKYQEIGDEIKKRMAGSFPAPDVPLTIHKTICGHVSNRGEKLKIFAEKHDTIIFVAGLNSSNGKVLYELCKQTNPNTHFAPDTETLQANWFENSKSVGVCGATSTPRWLMQDIVNQIKKLTENI